MNRIEEYFRDPTLEQPSADYFVVGMRTCGFVVRREDAERIIEALGSATPVTVRCQTVFGSVVYLRSSAVVFVRECTRSQRAAERRFWKEIDDEEDSEEDDS